MCKDAGDGKNVFMSPISLTTALAMVRAGAKANTAEQMKQTLKFTELPEEVGSLIFMCACLYKLFTYCK